MSISLLISYLLGYPIVYNLNSNTFYVLFLISVLLLPLQTTFEEVLFRGYLFQGFGVFFRKGWISVLVTGVLFGLMHGANPEVDRIGSVLLVYYVMTGVFLGVMTLMDDGLELSMGYHAVNNIFAAIVVTNDWQAFHTDALFMDKTPPSFGLENILTLLVLQPLIIFIFAKKYKWSNWKKRLFNTQIAEKE
jgi:membrane protease YdiL (CAAX protease family)